MARKEAAAWGDPAAKMAELKRELKKTVAAIVDERNDAFALDAIDKAKDVLLAIRDLKATPETTPFGDDDVSRSCPDEFKCPLSNLLMRDPVIVSTGLTYDKPYIQKWLKSGQRTCPKTQQVLSHTLLTPNHLIKQLISQWCKNRSISFPDHPPEPDLLILKSDRDRFSSLLDKLASPSITDQKSAAMEIRLLTKQMPAFRALFGENTSFITKLLTPLGVDPEPDLQEHLITTILNISIHDSNKKVVGEIPAVLEALTEALRRGTIESRGNAAAALFTLSALDSNKALIGQSGALRPLIRLLSDSGSHHPSAAKDAASAIFNLCILHENKGRAVVDGAVGVLLDRIDAGVHVDEMLAILAVLSSHQRAVEDMGELGAVGCLLRVIRETPCPRNKENCVAILYSLCMNDRTKLREMRAEEREHGTLTRLAREGTSRAKRKASGILERINRAVNLTHTA